MDLLFISNLMTNQKSLVLLYTLCFLGPVPIASYHWNRLEPVGVSITGPPVALPTPAGAPSDTGFVQLQAHMGPEWPAGYQLSLSSRPDFSPLFSASGRHTGLTCLNTSVTCSWYLRVDSPAGAAAYPGGANSTVWVLFAAKTWQDPIPGGCDLTSPVPNPPGLATSQLTAPGIAWRLAYALAGSFDARKRVKEPCNTSLAKANLIYRLYALELLSYSSEDLRLALEHMATAQEAVTYGRLIAIDGADGQQPKLSRFSVGARPSAPVIYTLVVEQTDSKQFSAYVPVILDDCDTTLSACVLAEALEWRVGTSVISLVGLLLCTIGFRYFTLSVLICGFSSGALLVLPAVLRALADKSPGQVWLAYLLGAGVAGFLLALFAIAVWLKCRSTVLALLFVHVPCCYLLACVVFATPFGRLWWLMREEYIFFLTLAMLMLLMLLLLLLLSNVGAIISLSVVGTFTIAVCVSTNLLVGSMLPYVFLDLFRRTAYVGYNQVHLEFALRHTYDWILIAAWLAAALLCCLLQYCWNRRALDPSRRPRRTRLDDSDNAGGGLLESSANVVVVNRATERTPLLSPLRERDNI